jgi:hypothetical protein
MKNKIKLIFTLTVIIPAIHLLPLKAQTLYVPGGIDGIGNNTANGNVGIGSVDTRGDKFHVNTGGQFFRAASWGIGVADSGWRNTLILSNNYNYSEIFNNDGQPIVLQVPNGGNVAIGTPTPSNQQGWGRVLDVNGPAHSKIIATAKGDDYITGMYSHQSWYGGGGFLGTESNHNLFFITNYNVKMAILTNGNVLIGKTSQIESRYKLDVEGPIRAHEIVINTTGADFVFEPTYKLRPLSELETFIHTNKHLPDIAPAKEMQENGVSAGEMQAKLLQKIEELTLYVIELKKENEELKNQNQVFQKRLDKIENLNDRKK